MESVKLTVRLPKLLHETLRRQAKRRNCSLNKTIVDMLWRGVDSQQEVCGLSQREQLLAAIREAELHITELDWVNKYVEAAPDVTIEEIREMWKDQRPLSEDIIADRGE